MLKNNKIKRTIKRKVCKRRRAVKKELILPLYFGWQFRVVLERVKDLREHIVGPFRKYWQYMTVVVLLIVLVSSTIFLNQHDFSKAATYGWAQTDWVGGADTSATASHSTDQIGWTKFYSSQGVATSTSGELKLERESN